MTVRRRSIEVPPWLRAAGPAIAVLVVQLVFFPVSAGAWLQGLVIGLLNALVVYPLLDLTRGQAAGILYEGLLLPLVMSAEPPETLPAEARYPTLGKGSAGPVVAWIERRLAALSYRPGAVDGVYDSATADAVMAFQKVERLERTGKASDAVQRRLASASTPLPRRWSSPPTPASTRRS